MAPSVDIPTDRSTSEFLGEVVRIAESAGQVISEIYATDFAISTKSDASPVTLADQRAETLILAGLERLTPEVSIVAEESVAAGNVPPVESANGWFWLVDPLDGTREFVSRNGEFTVNIALVCAGEPVLGVVFAPVIGVLYTGVRGLGA